MMTWTPSPTRSRPSRARGPFGEIADLGAITVPTVVIGSGDGADPEHPFAIAEAYASAIPGARLVSDPPDSSPIAWQGSRLSSSSPNW